MKEENFANIYRYLDCSIVKNRKRMIVEANDEKKDPLLCIRPFIEYILKQAQTVYSTSKYLVAGEISIDFSSKNKLKRNQSNVFRREGFKAMILVESKTGYILN